MTAALAAYAAGEVAEHAVLIAIAASRLLVPVVAVLAEANDDGTIPPALASGRSGPLSFPRRSVQDRGAPFGSRSGPPALASGRSGPLSFPRRSVQDRGAPFGSRSGPPAPAPGRPGPSGLRAEKETEMALPTLIGNDGRKAVIAFTGTDTIRRWRADARPVPVPAQSLWPAVAAEQAHAVVIDVAGPVPIVIEGARLRALADGAPPPLPHEDPDIRAQVAAVTEDFTLEPGGADTDLTITLKTVDPATARITAEAIGARLAARLRRGIAIRLG